MNLYRHHKAFTLIELLVSIAILAVFIGALFTFFRSQVFAFRNEDSRINMKESADVALDFLVKELRMAGARPVPEAYDAGAPAGCAPLVSVPGRCTNSAGGFEGLPQTTATSITLAYDFHDGAGGLAEGCANDLDERIRYTYDGANERITRQELTGPGPVVTLVDGVPSGGFNLRYFRANNTEIAANLIDDPGEFANRALVHRIDVTVTVEGPADPRMGGDMQTTRQRASIFMRNDPC